MKTQSVSDRGSRPTSGAATEGTIGPTNGLRINRASSPLLVVSLVPEGE